jgi:hypothetical protein
MRTVFSAMFRSSAISRLLRPLRDAGEHLCLAWREIDRRHALGETIETRRAADIAGHDLTL